VHVKIRNTHGKLEDVTLTRRTSYDDNGFAIDKSAPHFRLLDEHTGYADLNLLTPDEVDPMFDAFAKTRAVILDMRGYPNGTASALAARINTRHALIGAINAIPIVSVPSALIDADVQLYETDHSYQRIGVSAKPLYTGKVIVLIDDRAGSQSEHTCLFLEAATDVTFVGSPTHGSNGDVTTMLLPGGTHARFTGLEVLHADGRQLQQVGVQPTITVRQTVRGIRARKDEVLDRARRYVATGK
jgi:C-terminal processing protease CtpA/Prc